MAKKSQLIFAIKFLILLLLVTGCANQIAPGGGEIDKVPPQIIESVPLNGTTNFADDHIEITFDKYVDKRSVQDAIFISPTIQKGLKYDWSGKSLDIYFRDSLKKNTTYTVTIGTDAKDLNNSNKMAEAYTFTFSTGEKIDKGKLSGKVYDANSDGVMIYAYRKDTEEIDISKTKPDYVSQVGKNGKYELQGLSDGSYTVFAIRDKLRDFLYTKNDDQIGVQSKNIVLLDSTNNSSGINFFLTSEDTIAPQLSNVFMKDKNHLAVEFNKPIDSLRVSANNFYLLDTLTQKRVAPKYFFKGDAKQNQYYLLITDSLDQQDNWQLVADSVRDKQVNISPKEKNSFMIKTDRDTVVLKPLSVQGELPEGIIDIDNPRVLITFNDAVDSTTVKNKIIVEDAKKNPVQTKITKRDDASYDCLFLIKPKAGSGYSMKIDLKNYTDLSGNRIDSVFKFTLQTANELDFGGASGTIENSDSTNVVVVLQPVIQGKKVYSNKLDGKKNFNFKKVLPGKYLMWTFKDKNKNDNYDYGSVKPYHYSEEFIYYPDTLNLRARWPVGDISIRFGEK
jgi:hypothetical protein